MLLTPDWKLLLRSDTGAIWCWRTKRSKSVKRKAGKQARRISAARVSKQNKRKGSRQGMHSARSVWRSGLIAQIDNHCSGDVITATGGGWVAGRDGRSPWRCILTCVEQQPAEFKALDLSSTKLLLASSFHQANKGWKQPSFVTAQHTCWNEQEPKRSREKQPKCY